jgi:hypothetical protein
MAREEAEGKERPTRWEEHIDKGTTYEHMTADHDVSPNLYRILSDVGRTVLHVGAHESEGTAP